MISIQVNQQQLQEAEVALAFIANGYTRACVRSINRAADSALSYTAKAVAEVVTPAQKEIKKSLSVSKASYSNPTGKLTVEGSKIPLLAFSARQTQTGVSFQIFRNEPREKYRHAFKTVMQNSHEGIFEREPRPSIRWSRGRKQTWQPNLPIRERFGPSVPTVVEKTPGVLDGVLDKAAERFSIEFARQVDYLLQQQVGSD